MDAGDPEGDAEPVGRGAQIDPALSQLTDRIIRLCDGRIVDESRPQTGNDKLRAK